jgi:hypothetical protein
MLLAFSLASPLTGRPPISSYLFIYVLQNTYQGHLLPFTPHTHTHPPSHISLTKGRPLGLPPSLRVTRPRARPPPFTLTPSRLQDVPASQGYLAFHGVMGSRTRPASFTPHAPAASHASRLRDDPPRFCGPRWLPEYVRAQPVGPTFAGWGRWRGRLAGYRR